MIWASSHMIDTNDNTNVTPLIFVWWLNYHNKFDNIEKLEMYYDFLNPKWKFHLSPVPWWIQLALSTIQWYNFPINMSRFSQELLPPGNHPWSTTTSVGSISKECGWLRLDYNGLFGPRIHLSMLLRSHRRHLCLRLLLLQSRKELKFLAGGSEFV